MREDLARMTPGIVHDEQQNYLIVRRPNCLIVGRECCRNVLAVVFRVSPMSVVQEAAEHVITARQEERSQNHEGNSNERMNKMLWIRACMRIIRNRQSHFISGNRKWILCGFDLS
jgi:hypothetical protein